MTLSKREQLLNKKSYHQIDRLVNFSDAVIAIAVTLLILPLVDRAGELDIASPASFISATGQQFLLFLLSFIVICRFWLIHHNLLHSLEKFNASLFWLNALWLLSIVVIPFPTELLGRATGDSTFITGIYIANLLLTTVAGLAIQYQIRFHPGLQKPKSRQPVIYQGLSAALALCLALSVSLLVPAVGLWSLMLLFLSGVIEKVLRRIMGN